LAPPGAETVVNLACDPQLAARPIMIQPIRTIPSRLPLPETLERRCPSCASERIAPAGRARAGGGMIKEEFRCAACGTAFWFVIDSEA
jgi:DNA-directed RNA polymerase subunit RPC12/RpoP